MAYIICEPCVGIKDTACVDVCPVDCIHPAEGRIGFAAAEMCTFIRRMHRRWRVCAGLPRRSDLCADETPRAWDRFISINARYYQE